MTRDELAKRIERGVRMRTLHLHEIMADDDQQRREVNAYAWAATVLSDAIGAAQRESDTPDWCAVLAALSFDLYLEFFERAPELAETVEVIVEDEFVGVRP